MNDFAHRTRKDKRTEFWNWIHGISLHGPKETKKFNNYQKCIKLKYAESENKFILFYSGKDKDKRHRVVWDYYWYSKNTRTHSQLHRILSLQIPSQIQYQLLHRSSDIFKCKEKKFTFTKHYRSSRTQLRYILGDFNAEREHPHCKWIP